MQVLIAGDPRPLAQAKHCDWVTARRPLEHLKQQTAADEVILSSSTGELLEGLASNWYVVANESQLETSVAAPAVAGQPADLTKSSSSRTSRLVLLTTGSMHAALLGVTQQRVLEAAAAVGLEVLQQPAKLQQRHAWREAFITNW